MREHERTDRRSLNNSTISPNSSTCNCRCSTQLHRSRPFQLIILCTTLHGVNGSMNPLKSARILSAGCRREPAHICHLGLIEVSQLKFCHKDIGLELWLLRNWKHARARNLSIDQKPSHILLFVVLNYVEILSLGERVEQGATAPLFSVVPGVVQSVRSTFYPWQTPWPAGAEALGGLCLPVWCLALTDGRSFWKSMSFSGALCKSERNKSPQLRSSMLGEWMQKSYHPLS